MSVDVVGKYAYDLFSPYDDRRVPVVVDVVLVGRTKILKVGQCNRSIVSRVRRLHTASGLTMSRFLPIVFCR